MHQTTAMAATAVAKRLCNQQQAMHYGVPARGQKPAALLVQERIAMPAITVSNAVQMKMIKK
jgi:hypothetical protein